MIIALDLDGVLANWTDSYVRLITETSGRRLLPAPYTPATWHFDIDAGYTQDERRVAKRAMRASHDFWIDLDPLDNMETLRLMWPSLIFDHDVYFVTNRVGTDAKWQSERWLMLHLGDATIDTPTVLIARDNTKGAIAASLGADIFVEDRLDNARDIVTKSPKTRTYLLDYPYNRDQADLVTPPPYTRIRTLGEMFDLEIERL